MFTPETLNTVQQTKTIWVREMFRFFTLTITIWQFTLLSCTQHRYYIRDNEFHLDRASMLHFALQKLNKINP